MSSLYNCLLFACTRVISEKVTKLGETRKREIWDCIGVVKVSIIKFIFLGTLTAVDRGIKF